MIDEGYQEKWRRNHPDYHKRYYQKNKERIRALQKKYMKTEVGKQQAKDAMKRFLEKNPNAGKKWREKNPIRYKWGRLKRSAREREMLFDERLKVFDNFRAWWESQEQVCHYCGISMELVRQLGDLWVKILVGRRDFSVDRKDNDVGYLEDNMVLCCFKCNYVKSDFFSYEEFLVIGEIIRKKWEKLKAIILRE